MPRVSKVADTPEEVLETTTTVVVPKNLKNIRKRGLKKERGKKM